MAAGSAMSACTAMALPPACVMASTTRCAPAALVAQLTTTDAPCAASALAMPAPMPFDAPVTRAALPASLALRFAAGDAAVLIGFDMMAFLVTSPAECRLQTQGSLMRNRLSRGIIRLTLIHYRHR